MAGDTLAVTRQKARLACRLTTVDVLTSDLDFFINEAERHFTLAVYESNPMVGASHELIQYPGGGANVDINALLTASLGAGREVFKIVRIVNKPQAGSYATMALAATSEFIELSGTGWPTDQRPQEGSPLMYLFDGHDLWIYPVSSGPLPLQISYLRVPKPATTAGDTLFADFRAPMWELCNLVAYYAARDLRASRGLDVSWLQAKIKDEEDHKLNLRHLHKQEAESMIGSRRHV